MEIIRLGPGDTNKVMAAGHLFDSPPKPDATEPTNAAALATYQKAGGRRDEEPTTVLTWLFDPADHAPVDE
jgi:hypothetical protein